MLRQLICKLFRHKQGTGIAVQQ